MREDLIKRYLPDVPSEFQVELCHRWADFVAHAESDDLEYLCSTDVFPSLPKVWICSHFIALACVAAPNILIELVRSGDLQSDSAASRYRERFKVLSIETEEDLHQRLRVFRKREMIRIAWRDIAGWSDLDETLADLSELAQTCIQGALDFLYGQACERKGKPLLSNGDPQELTVLGMGKLGAWELNYSSDIDLIFAYPTDGCFDDKRGTSYEEFFTRLGQKLILALDQKTADGFVYRVDMRLRPWGNSGPLAMSFPKIEKYYIDQGRQWERYAMVKVRPVAGDLVAGDQLLQAIRPFVYRPYLDYGIFSELRELKRMITSELKKKHRIENVKLGPGGIREIEFIAQVFQLIRGGRDERLQEPRVQKIISLLKESELISAKMADGLQNSYRYLRVVEHRLQEYKDQQVNDLPGSPEDQLRLAYSMNCKDWASFKSHLDQVRERVKEVFEQVFASPQLQDQHENANLIWTSVANDDEKTQMLSTMGYTDVDATSEALTSFHKSSLVHGLTEKGSDALDLLMPQVISASSAMPNPDPTLLRIVKFFRVVARRSMYLSLLLEDPLALTQLIQLSSASVWISVYVSGEPSLLDELLKPSKLYDPLMKEDLAEELAASFVGKDLGNLEGNMLQLRYFKQVYVLRVAAADVSGIIPLIVVSDYLCDIAEVIIETAVQLAFRSVIESYQKADVPIDTGTPGMCVVALGKAGSRELSYDSNLELQLLWEEQSSQEGNLPKGILPQDKADRLEFFRRVAKRFDALMTTRLLSGILYSLTTPIENAPKDGLVMVEMGAYESHDINTQNRASMIRARVVAGDPALARRFEALRVATLMHQEDPQGVRSNIASKRHRTRDGDDISDSGGFHLHHSKGGIGDIESIINLGVLTNVSDYPELATSIETMSLLHELVTVGFLTKADHKILQEAYMRYRARLHKVDLQDESLYIPAAEFCDLRQGVSRIYESLFLNG